jgi:hypothetical protein
MKNLNRDSEPAGEQMTLFSQAGSLSHASPTHSQENASEKRMNATCGPKCLESFERFNQPGSWAKMFSALLIGRTDWYSTRCRLTWKLRGTKYNRMYFQLAPSTLRTDATGFGLLHTPKAVMIEETPENFRNRMNKNGKKDRKNGFPNLAVQAKYLLPTPQARDEKHGSQIQDRRIQRKIQKGWTIDLNDMATMGLLPTPTANEYKDSNNTPETLKKIDKGGRVLRWMATNEILEPGKTSQLNPRFVLEMMGFPPDWTELPFQSGATKASKQPATP